MRISFIITIKVIYHDFLIVQQSLYLYIYSKNILLYLMRIINKIISL
nr:MAG TPA: hypothetical protein [Caudoviricetes sp.]